MTSSVKDKDGRAFDPAIHQAAGDGSPRINRAGFCYLKGRRKARNGKGKAQLAAKRAARANPPPAKPAPETPEVKPPEPAPAAPAVPEGLPREIGLARPSDIVAEMPPVTIDEPTPGASQDPETPQDPDASYVAPDEPAPAGVADPAAGATAGAVPAADPQQAGLATMAVEVYEQTGRALIDAKEWEFEPPERAWMAGKVTAVLEKHGINPELSEEGELALCMGVIAMRRSHLPKTRAWLAGAWGWFAGLFAPRKPAPKNPPPQADKPRNEADQPAPTA